MTQARHGQQGPVRRQGPITAVQHMLPLTIPVPVPVKLLTWVKWLTSLRLLTTLSVYGVGVLKLYTPTCDCAGRKRGSYVGQGGPEERVR
jgi:hypothetical protein